MIADCHDEGAMSGFSTMMSWTRIGLPLATMLVMHGNLEAQPPLWIERMAFWRTDEVDGLRQKIQTIDRQLATLPSMAGINSGERIGFQTAGITPGEDPWIEVELPVATLLDQVVLVPLLAKGMEELNPGFGFPRRFILEGFSDDSNEPIILRDERAREFPNPACYPVSAAVPAGIALRRIRLTATEVWSKEGSAVFGLSEVMLLHGNRNLTQEAKVKTSSSREIAPTWSRNNLLDMTTPLGLPLAPAGSPLMGWHGEVQTSMNTKQYVTVDLGDIQKIDEIRLTPAWTDRMPWDAFYGFPSRFLLEGSASGDDGSWFIIYDRSKVSLKSPGRNLQIFPVSKQPVRFIRMTATRLRSRTGDFTFALGEFQVYQNDNNIALGAAVTAEGSLINDQWQPEGLTDGRAAGGRFLEFAEWIRLLQQRRTLEARHENLQTRLGSTLERIEHEVIGGSTGGALAIVVVTGTLSWRGRRRRMFERERFRERLARDLHDELGSNLSTIALVSSLATQGDAAQMHTDLAEIEIVARESADSMRDMISLLGRRRKLPGGDWLVVLKALAERVLRELESELALPSAPLIWEPDLETRRELYLFCKEVLYNAVRHGSPSKVRFALHPTPSGGLRIEIEDNGKGFDAKGVPEGHGLGNLRERADIMRADLQIDSHQGRGTTITLDIPRGLRWRKA
ncbi:MAG: ATP-binding protein [Verrucomicrobiota bacterium]